jgi:hypothetical protein
VAHDYKEALILKAKHLLLFFLCEVCRFFANLL